MGPRGFLSKVQAEHKHTDPWSLLTSLVNQPISNRRRRLWKHIHNRTSLSSRLVCTCPGEFYSPFYCSNDSPVSTQLDAFTSKPFGASLPDNDLSHRHFTSLPHFDAQTFTTRVSSVLGTRSSSLRGPSHSTQSLTPHKATKHPLHRSAVHHQTILFKTLLRVRYGGCISTSCSNRTYD